MKAPHHRCARHGRIAAIAIVALVAAHGAVAYLIYSMAR